MSTLSPWWDFAEGGSGAFTTYVAVWNPNATATGVRLYYRHENGTVYSQDVTLPALGRAVVGTPSWVPTGGFGMQVASLTSTGLVAERMVYGGPTWELGHAGPGAPTGLGAGTTWRFAEGTAAGAFETYFLLSNLSGTAATAAVTLTYRTAAGVVIGTDALVIPAYGRGTVWANGTTGAQDFTTEVTSAVPILAERAMYWPTGSSSLLGSESASLPSADTAGAERLGGITPAGPSPYTVVDGVPGPTEVKPGAARDVVVGKRAPTSRGGTERGEPTQSSSSGPAWYGSHLTLGKRP